MTANYKEACIMESTCTLTEAERKKQNRDELTQILKEHPELFETALSLILESIRNGGTE